MDLLFRYTELAIEGIMWGIFETTSGVLSVTVFTDVAFPEAIFFVGRWRCYKVEKICINKDSV